MRCDICLANVATTRVRFGSGVRGRYLFACERCARPPGALDEVVGFSLDGEDYEVTLSPAEAAELRRRLAPFVAAAERQTAKERFARQLGLDAGALEMAPLDYEPIEHDELARMANDLLRCGPSYLRGVLACLPDVSL